MYSVLLRERLDLVKSKVTLDCLAFSVSYSVWVWCVTVFISCLNPRHLSMKTLLQSTESQL